MNRTQFTFYESFFAAISRIRKKADRADAYDAICAYALYGTEPDLDALPDAVAIAFVSAKPNLDASKRKAESGKRGGGTKQTEANGKQTANKPKQTGSKSKQTASKPKQAVSEIESEIENEIEIEIEIERESDSSPPKSPVGGPRFTPPSAQDVAAYCAESGHSVDADLFVDFYESKNWMVGKNKMRDWRAAVRNWARRDRDEGRAGGKTSNPFLNALEEGVFDE